MKVALISTVVLVVCSVALTAVSIYNAEGILSSSDYWKAQIAEDGAAELPHGQNADTIITIRQFNATSIVLCAFVNLLGGTIIYLIMGRALRPLTMLTAAIERIDEQSSCQSRLRKQEQTMKSAG